MVRLFTFKNNFLSDNVSAVSAEYNVFGYFDGLSMEAVDSDGEALRIMNDPMRMQKKAQQTFEMCDYYNIVGICQDNSDQKFWQKGGEPYIFISCLRFRNRLDDPKEFVSKIETQYKNLCLMSYTTLDSSDLIICIRTSRYSQGDEVIESYTDILQDAYPKNQIQKVFSVSLIYQPVLDILGESTYCQKWPNDVITAANQEIEKLADEQLDCSVRCMVKDRKKFTAFCEKLFGKCGGAGCISVYGLLGSDDMVLEMRHIPAKTLLGMYGAKGILTHDNETYRGALYNARSEILSFKAIFSKKN